MQRSVLVVAALAAAAVAGGCRQGDEPPPGPTTPPDGTVSAPAGFAAYDSALIERGRLDPAWREWAERDRSTRTRAVRPTPTPPPGAPDTLTAAQGADAAAAERFDEISAETTNRRPRLPVGEPGGGPSVLHVQVLLDRANFSPGVLDGRWGKNTEKAVYWFQYDRGLEPTGQVDAVTYDLLVAASRERPAVEPYTLTADDLAGPFVDLPDDVYEKAELDCLCYESAIERLAERLHATPELLAQLNPGLDAGALQEGTTLWVPAVRDGTNAPEAGAVDRIVISKNGFYTQALAADGRILFHFPSTLGTDYDPTPDGEFHVTGITFEPHFHYQPELFHEVPDDDPTAMLPPGPNSPVGVVWIALSKPHYGIHGTPEPRTIGYTSSHGCVRLTNWDAELLAHHVARGTPVHFH